jgi:O-antigen/teichoic acid export membrane protein
LSIKANVAANYFGQIYAALMGFAFVPICIKYLGTEAYGLVAIFAILQSSAALLDLGLKPTMAREMARFNVGARSVQSIRDLLRSAETLGACIGTLVALAIWLSSSFLATHWLNATRLPPGSVAHALTGMGLICSLRFVENIFVGSIIGLQRQVTLCIVSCTVMSARAFGSVAVLALFSPTVDAFFAWQTAISIISIPIYAIVVYRSLPQSLQAGRFSWSTVTGIWRFSGGIAANALLALLLLQLDKILLSARLSLKEFSYYAVASVLSNALYMLSMPISAAFYPSFTELSTRGETEALRRTYHQAAQLMAVIMGSAAIVLIAFPDTALNAWTGDAGVTLHATPLLRVLALGTLLNGFVGIPYQLQLATGWTSLTVTLNAVAVSVLAPTLFVVIPIYGAIGAAWIWVALNLGNLVFYIYFMHRRLLSSEKWRWYREDVLAPTAAGALTAGLCRIILPTHASTIAEVGVLTIAFMTITLAAALACQSTRSQLRKIALGALRRTESV